MHTLFAYQTNDLHLTISNDAPSAARDFADFVKKNIPESYFDKSLESYLPV